MRRRLPDGTIDPTDTGKKQPDGAINLHHVHHQTTLADIVTIHPTAASYMTTIYASVGCLATKKEGAKDNKYGAEARQLQFRFQAAGIETFGAPGAGLVKLVEDIVAHAAEEDATDTRRITGWGAPHVREVAWQAIAVARVRGIAAAFRAAGARRAAEQPIRRRADRVAERLPSAAVWRASARASEWAAEGEREQQRARRQALAAVRADEQALTLARARPVSVGSGVVSVASVSPRASVVAAAAALPAVPLAAAVVDDGLDGLDLGSLDFSAPSASSPPSTGGGGAAAASLAVRQAVVRRGAHVGPEVVPPQVSECPPLSLHAWYAWWFLVFASLVFLCVFVWGVVAKEGTLAVTSSFDELGAIAEPLSCVFCARGHYV